MKTKTALLFTLLFLVTLSLAGNSGCKKKSQSTEAGVSKKTEGTTVKKEAWGNIDGKEVFLYTLTNSNGLVCKLTNWGATVTELHVPDRDGNVEDVVLGFESERPADDDGFVGEAASTPVLPCQLQRRSFRLRPACNLAAAGVFASKACSRFM